MGFWESLGEHFDPLFQNYQKCTKCGSHKTKEISKKFITKYNSKRYVMLRYMVEMQCKDCGNTYTGDKEEAVSERS